jgi:hypothetical protein
VTKLGRPPTGLESFQFRFLRKLINRIDRIIALKKELEPNLNRSKWAAQKLEAGAKEDESELGIE